MTVPEGYVRHDRTSPLTAPWEPLFAKREVESVKLGLEIRLAHTNSRGLLHGGLISTLADNAMGLSLAARLAKEGRPANSLVTTSLSVDFVASAACGQWLVIDPVVIHAGGGQGVVQALARADGKVIARASATFRFRHEHIKGDT